MMNALTILGDILHLPLNTERLKKLTESSNVDNNNIKKALGISRLPIEAKEGLVYSISNLLSGY